MMNGWKDEWQQLVWKLMVMKLLDWWHLCVDGLRSDSCGDSVRTGVGTKRGEGGCWIVEGRSVLNRWVCRSAEMFQSYSYGSVWTPWGVFVYRKSLWFCSCRRWSCLTWGFLGWLTSFRVQQLTQDVEPTVQTMLFPTCFFSALLLQWDFKKTKVILRIYLINLLKLRAYAHLSYLWFCTFSEINTICLQDADW